MMEMISSKAIQDVLSFRYCNSCESVCFAVNLSSISPHLEFIIGTKPITQPPHNDKVQDNPGQWAVNNSMKAQQVYRTRRFILGDIK